MAKKDSLGVRLESLERNALAAAAAAEDRAQSALARRIIAGWLKENGWLPIESMQAEGNRRHPQRKPLL